MDAFGGVKYTDIIGGQLDGGIPRYASVEFRDWMEEIKSNLGERSLSEAMLSNPFGVSERLARAMTADTKKHNVYVLERNWAEFNAVGREPAGLDDPAVYFQAICIRRQKIGWEDALTEFDGITKALGRDNVLQAIQQVHAAPRERFGVLKVTMPPPVKRAPGGSFRFFSFRHQGVRPAPGRTGPKQRSGARDNDQVRLGLQSTEDSLAVIEDYVK